MNATKMTFARTVVLFLGVFAFANSYWPDVRLRGAVTAGELEPTPRTLVRAQRAPLDRASNGEARTAAFISGDPLGACCDPATGDCQDTVESLCLAGGGNFLPGANCAADPCQDGACCDFPTAGECTATDPGMCKGTGGMFLGYGTACEPNCCPQVPTGGDDCGAATIHNLIVPFDGFGDPIPGGVVVTISGDSTPATGGDCPALDPDLGWWESFSIDVDAKVSIDLCCDDDIPTASYIIVYENCNAGVCADSNFSDTNGRGSPVCTGGDNNLWNVWNNLPAGDYFYPIFADITDDPLNLGDYQLHIRAEGHPKQACCFADLCDDSLTGPECEAAGGWWFDGIPTCALANCGLGSCCTGGAGQCESNGDVGIAKPDCDAMGGEYVGGSRCSDNPCPLCDIDQPGNCQRDTGQFIVLIDRAITDGLGNYSRWADDFTPAVTGQIDELCWWPAFLGDGFECSAPGEPPANPQWQVNFYEDAGGLPGPNVGAPDLPVTVHGWPLPGGASRVWLKQGDLGGSGPTVTAGECYWFEITGFGDGPGGCSIYWAFSADGNHYSMNDTDLSYGPEDVITGVGDPLNTNVDMAFCLDVGVGANGCGVFTGTCCLPVPLPCEDDMSVTACEAAGGTFVPGPVTCATPAVCPDRCDAENCTDAIDLNSEVCSGGLPCTRPVDNLFCDETVVGTTCRVTPGGPVTPNNDFGSDTWFSYTTAPDECGTIRLDMCANGTYDGMLAVYKMGPTCGCPADITEPDECGDDTCGVGGGMPTVVARNVEPGDCLMIRVGGWAGDQGEGELSISVEVHGDCPNPPERPNPKEWNAPARTPCTPPFFCTNNPGIQCEKDSQCLSGDTCNSPCPGEAHCIPAPNGTYPGTCYAVTSRYLSVAPNPFNAGIVHARRISLDTGGAPLVLGWMGPPDANGVVRIVDEASRHYMDWTTPLFPLWCSLDVHCPNLDCDVVAQQCLTSSTNVVHVGDCAISPGHTYRIEAIADAVPITDPTNYSSALSLDTVSVWGDVIGATVGGGAFNLPANGAAEFGDVLGIVKGFQGQGGSPPEWFDLVAVSGTDPVPDYDVGFGDILAAVKGFQNEPYPLDDPCTCIGQPPCP